MLRQNLSQKQLQKLSPQQIQLMKLLQLPTDALEQRIKEELEANPALDDAKNAKDEEEDKLLLSESKEEDDYETTENEKDDFIDDNIDLSEYFDENDNTASYNDYSYNPDDEDEGKSTPLPVGVTFHENLYRQLGLRELDDHEYSVASQLIGSIDEDGYLRRELEDIVDDLAFSANVATNETELEHLLKIIQEFDPAGVGARDLQECLLIQLRRKEDKTTHTDLAIDILQNHFEEFTKKHFDKLIKTYNCDADQIKNAYDEIIRLNPKPGSAYNEGGVYGNMHYIVPDFLIENVNGELILRLNARNAPELRVSDSFKEMLKSYNRNKDKSRSQKEAVFFIKQKIDSAKWFIDAVKQRQQTLMKTMKAILEHQYEFFLTGDEMNLRPMILKDIAEKTDLDISTVSRVANSKYVQTEFGTYLLKFLFSESLSTDSGEEVSTREVKKILSELIGDEKKKKPLSDQRLTEILNEKGYNIARRTVAKYREQLNIPVARLRKEI